MSDEERLRQEEYDTALAALDVPRLSIRPDELRDATADRDPFDIIGWELIARTGMMCEMLVVATGSLPDGSRRGLTLDEAVNGGLLVRITKLTRALFDSTQAEESEAHQILARCIAETSINLRWLLSLGDSDAYARFRADGYRTFLRILDRVDTTHEDPVVKGTATRVLDALARELKDAEIDRDDVPMRPGQWAGTLRDRFEDLDEAGLYDVFFGTHSDFVHGSWHELRTFHLRMTPSGYAVDLEYGGLTPSAMYETVRLVVSALREYLGSMPVAGVDGESLRTVAHGTIEAAHFAGLEFARFIAEGGIDEDMDRLLQTQREASIAAVRDRVESQSTGTFEAFDSEKAAPGWASELVERFGEARRGLKVCPHLQQDPDQPSIWLAALPDFLACQGRECERRLIPTLQQRLGHTLAEEPAHCSICGRQAPVQGVSLGVGTTLIRAIVCAKCRVGKCE